MVSQIALAPVAGAVVAFAGPGPAFAVNAATFLVSAAFRARLSIPERPPPLPAKHLDDVIEGLRAIRVSRFLPMLAGVQGLAGRQWGFRTSGTGIPEGAAFVKSVSAARPT